MSDIIQLLPDSVANQIAAGEVIQRPASVIKELVENAIDAGASQIRINIRDAGRSSIQIIDNGKGMSPTDARLSFERHATSKIRDAKDLFAIQTMGFRGEALASIAAIAQVELKTRRPEDELGTHIQIAGSELVSQDACQTSVGSNFMVKNLFYNVPVRRKFLKSNSTEFKYIVQEIQRVALSYPSISFALNHNDTEVYQLLSENPLKRVEQLFRKSLSQQLLPIQTQTSIVNIHGYIGKPEAARKNSGEQFFFVNKRFMKHPYFHRAVVQAYERLLPADSWPSYFIYFTIDPAAIDINIHPTKTEIKFEDENNIWRILQLSVKEALGKFNIVPSIDFDTKPVIDIPALDPNKPIRPPQIQINPDYNPFQHSQSNHHSTDTRKFSKKEDVRNWESLYQGFDTKSPSEHELIFPSSKLGNDQLEKLDYQNQAGKFFHFKNRFIIGSVKSGLLIIDHRRAHIRVLFEQYLKRLQAGSSNSQGLLFPEEIDLSLDQGLILQELIPALKTIGFDIDDSELPRIKIAAIPAEFSGKSLSPIIESLLENFQENQSESDLGLHEKIANSMAITAAMKLNRVLCNEEMEQLAGDLFACEYPQYTPSGKLVLNIIPVNEIEQLF